MNAVIIQLSLLITLILSVSAQLMAPMKNFNVTSPVSNGLYVTGQVLPCTYQLFSDVDSSSLRLQIKLQSAGSQPELNNATIIVENADVSKTQEFLKQNGNTTYYEHSINYNIPKTITPGNYLVVFLDLSTNTQLSVPIDIRAAQATSSASSKPSSSGRERSIFDDSPATKPTGLTVKALIALAAVAGVAIML